MEYETVCLYATKKLLDLLFAKHKWYKDGYGLTFLRECSPAILLGLFLSAKNDGKAENLQKNVLNKPFLQCLLPFLRE